MDYKRIYSIVAKIILSKTMTESQWKNYLKQHPRAKRRNHHIIPDRKRKNLMPPASRPLKTTVWQREKARNEILITHGIEDVDFRKRRGINPIYKYDRKSGISSVFKPFSSLKNTHLRRSLSPKISQSEREVIAFRLSDWLGLNIVPPTYWRHRNVENSKKPMIGTEQLYIKSEDFFDTFVTSTGIGIGNVKSTQLNISNFERSPIFSQFKKNLLRLAPLAGQLFLKDWCKRS